ncbi:MAG: TolC family protein, partial [Planctomycetes bacterium]|nr:TolC family protein [Planctomycetota bacterium]
ERIGISKARAGPSVDASVIYGANTGEDRTTDDAKFLLQFRLPLYAGGVLEARKRREMKKLRQLEMKLQAAERQALADVERALIELSSSKSRLDAGSRAVALAEEALRVENQKFKEGRGTSNDLLLAEEALLRAKTAIAAAISDNRIAFAALRFASGELDVPSE